MKYHSYNRLGVLVKRLGVLVLIFSLGCREAKHSGGGSVDSAGVDSTASVPAVGTADFRSRLIVALKEVRGEAASRDSSVVARMFRFPFPDSAIRISGDSNFEKVKDHGNVSRELFLYGYSEFVQELQLEEFGAGFRNLDINKLRTADSVVFDEKDSAKRCLRGYGVRIMSDSLVEVQAWQNTKEGYSGVGREDAACEEFLLTWEFVFDGRRLYMIDHSEAD